MRRHRASPAKPITPRAVGGFAQRCAFLPARNKVHAAGYGSGCATPTPSPTPAPTPIPTATPTSAPNTAFSQDVLALKPYVYYRLDKANGATVIDSSGKGRNGTLSGTYTQGVLGLLCCDSDTVISLNEGSAALLNWLSNTAPDFTTVVLFESNSYANGPGGRALVRLPSTSAVSRCIPTRTISAGRPLTSTSTSVPPRHS